MKQRYKILWVSFIGIFRHARLNREWNTIKNASHDVHKFFFCVQEKLGTVRKFIRRFSWARQIWCFGLVATRPSITPWIIPNLLSDYLPQGKWVKNRLNFGSIWLEVRVWPRRINEGPKFFGVGKSWFVGALKISRKSTQCALHECHLWSIGGKRSLDVSVVQAL